MDLFTKWNQRITSQSAYSGQEGSVEHQVRQMLAQHIDLWWSCDGAVPVFPFTFLPKQQADNEKRLEQWINGLITELKRIPQDPQGRQAWQERLQPALEEFAAVAMNLETRHLDFIKSTRMIEASQEFARMARQFDPQISAEDIYQAGRNIMTANFIQVLLGLPVEITPSVFAYSMLYPYTDNYLDDPAISRTTKLAFNNRFQRRLRGEEVHPANSHEATINRLVEMIETQWDRARYAQVYESLLAIHEAQVRSMALAAPGASPYELDVLGISFEKGGTSVLADGYLVAGYLTPAQASFLFEYGCYTQLMDDLEDIEQDMREGCQTVFSQTAGRWPMDKVTNRMIHFGRAIFDDLGPFPAQAAQSMQELINRSIDSVLIDIAGRAERYFSKEYRSELERHVSFRFACTRRQREKLERQKINLGKLVETLI